MFTEISYYDFMINPIDRMKNDWFLITSGNQDCFNSMTASWGGIGHLWNENVAFLFVRPQRFTHTFIENYDTLTISFFTKNYRKALALLGSKSGKDTSKIEESGLTPMKFHSSMAYKEAEYVLVCKKLYCHTISEENMLGKELLEHYPNHDFHSMYIVKIENIYKKVN